MIHDSAFIDPSAEIADNVTIGAFCHIGKNVILEDGCVLASHVILNNNVTCKADVKIFSHVNIGNGISHIFIGQRTHIREFSLIATETQNTKDVLIEDDNFIMAYVKISNGTKMEKSCVVTNAVTILEDVTCKEKVIVGGLSTIEAGVSIGTGVMIGGASYIDRDMPPFTLVEGNHAQVRGLNIVGLRRRLDNKDDIKEIKSAYKSIYKESINKDEAKRLLQNSDNIYVKEFCKFIVDYNV
jgi:UDP-N-acetylglucosamine acyltransferase